MNYKPKFWKKSDGEKKGEKNILTMKLRFETIKK